MEKPTINKPVAFGGLVLLATAVFAAAGQRTGWADSAPASATGSDTVRAIVQEEVAKELQSQMPRLVQAEVHRQLAELIRRDQDATRGARAISILQTVRSQIVLYALQHNDAYTTLAEFQNGWSVLVRPTNGAGKIMPPSAEGYGPYLPAPMKNPFNNSDKVVAAGHVSAGAGWTYDEKSHLLKVLVPANELKNFRGADVEPFPSAATQSN